MGNKVGEDMCDAGIIANRYRLELVGNTQTLRLTSWDALPRIDKTIAFKFEPKTWYSMKLTTDIKGDKGVIKGKVWETRQGLEPKAGGRRGRGPAAQPRRRQGSFTAMRPGILPGQIGSEAFYDNVKITVPNKAGPRSSCKTDSEVKPEKKPETIGQKPASTVPATATAPGVEFAFRVVRRRLPCNIVPAC